PGPVGFAWTQREPDRDCCSADLDSTGEGHQRRRKDGPGGRRSRDPSPATPNGYPAPIVEGRIAPGLVFNPHPAPGGMVDPVAIAIGRPARGYAAREPDSAVLRSGLPVSGGVKLHRAGDVRAHVAKRDRARDHAVALLAPVVQLVRPRRLEPL